MGKSNSAEDQHCSNLYFSVSRSNALHPQGMQPFSNWGGHGLHDICSISGAGEGSFCLGWGGSSHNQSSSSTLGWIAGISRGQSVLRGYCSSCAQCLEQRLCCTHFCRASSARRLPGLTSHAGACTLTSLSDAVMMMRAVPQPRVRRGLALPWCGEVIRSRPGPFKILRDSLRLQEGNFHLA